MCALKVVPLHVVLRLSVLGLVDRTAACLLALVSANRALCIKTEACYVMQSASSSSKKTKFV